MPRLAIVGFLSLPFITSCAAPEQHLIDVFLAAVRDGQKEVIAGVSMVNLPDADVQSWDASHVAEPVAAGMAPRAGTCRAAREMNGPLPLDEWQRLGVRLTNGAALPKADMNASLVSGSSRHFLVYDNYEALLSYNCAHSYALGVALLSDRVAAGR